MDETDKSTELLQELLQLETLVWQALVTGDRAADDALLAHDFLGVYPDGFAGRDAHVGQLDKGATVAEFHLTDIRVRAMGQGYGLLAYRADYRRPDRPDLETMLVSSIWQRAGAGWINIFSQDTPLSGETLP